MNDNNLGGNTSSGSPLIHQSSQGLSIVQPSLRRGSPPNLLSELNGATRSVPATPLGMPSNPLLKTPGTPLGDSPNLNGRLSTQGLGETTVNASDLQASLSRLPGNRYENGAIGFNGMQSGLDESLRSVSIVSPFFPS